MQTINAMTFDGVDKLVPATYRVRRTFRAEYDQYKELDGLPFALAEVIDHATAEIDEESLPMFRIRIAGMTMLAWPEETMEWQGFAHAGND